MARALIFDFDGVLADSELLANQVLADLVSELGRPTSRDEALTRYTGKRAADVLAAVALDVGAPLPPDFGAILLARTLARFRSDLRLVAGARAFLDAFADMPRCIASSSSPDRLAACLDILGLRGDFDGRVFSAASLARGKPHPDIFLFAADRLGIAPRACIVIEDSVGGVTAGVAAGATVIALLAGSHIRDGDAQRLADAGAHHLARTFREAEQIVRALL